MILLSLTLTSCGALMTGMLMGLSSYPAASSSCYNSWNIPSWDNPTYFQYLPPVAPSWGSIGSYSVPESSSSFSSSSSSSSSESTKVSINSCPRCHGSGRVAIETFPPQFGLEDYHVKCNECGQSFLKSMGHTHITCPVCHGHKK